MTFELMMNTLRLAGFEVHKEETDNPFIRDGGKVISDVKPL